MTDVGKYLDFVIKLFLVFGLTFETPAAIVLACWTGFVTPQQLSARRDYVVVGCVRGRRHPGAAGRAVAGAAGDSDVPAVRAGHLVGAKRMVEGQGGRSRHYAGADLSGFFPLAGDGKEHGYAPG